CFSMSPGREHYEISPPHILPSDRERCCTVRRFAYRAGASLSDAAGALHRAIPTWRVGRSHRSCAGQPPFRGWDDFIVRDQNGDVFSVPTVPFDMKKLTPFQMPNGAPDLQPDDRFAGRIKWYVKLVVFGGDPEIGDNLVWVSHEEHAELVLWWNERYRELTRTA